MKSEPARTISVVELSCKLTRVMREANGVGYVGDGTVGTHGHSSRLARQCQVELALMGSDVVGGEPGTPAGGDHESFAGGIGGERHRLRRHGDGRDWGQVQRLFCDLQRDHPALVAKGDVGSAITCDHEL